MSFQVQQPETLPPEILDHLLATGWYRMRQTMFTCRYLLGVNGLHTALWTRLPLLETSLRPGQRKLLRRVERGYRVEIRPFEMTEEHAELYVRYRAHVGGNRADRLATVLYDGESAVDSLNRFDSWEVCIRTQEGALAAFSVFDCGHTAMQSILGVYAPEVEGDSLGYATMLFEIEWGRARQMHHHYAGYVVPGVPTFEYKKRVGTLEVWDPDSRTWVPLGDPDPETLPAQRMRRELNTLSWALDDVGITAELHCHPPYRLVHAQRLDDWCFGLPLLLHCGPLRRRNERLIASYDPVTRRFEIDACRPNRDLSVLLADDGVPAEGPPPEWRLMVRVRKLASVETVEQAVAFVLQLRLRGWPLSRG